MVGAPSLFLYKIQFKISFVNTPEFDVYFYISLAYFTNLPKCLYFNRLTITS